MFNLKNKLHKEYGFTYNETKIVTKQRRIGFQPVRKPT